MKQKNLTQKQLKILDRIQKLVKIGEKNLQEIDLNMAEIEKKLI